MNNIETKIMDIYLYMIWRVYYYSLWIFQRNELYLNKLYLNVLFKSTIVASFYYCHLTTVNNKCRLPKFISNVLQYLF